MNIQQDIRHSLLRHDEEYGDLLIGLLEDLEDGRVSTVKIKERLMIELTEWVLEEGAD